MRFKWFLILGILCASIVGAREPGQTTIKSSRTVLLKFSSQNTDPRIVIFENDSLRIEIPRNHLLHALDAWMNDDYHASDRDLQRYILTLDSTAKFTSLFAKIHGDFGLQRYLEYRRNLLLDKGEALVYDKLARKYHNEISVQEYIFDCGDLCGDAGTLYFAGSLLIAKVVKMEF